MRIIWIILAIESLGAAPVDPFDGSRWNISTGNLNVQFIQHSPIGAHPLADWHEPLPSLESLKQMKARGLVAHEDYIAWGAIEREPGKWDWSQHDKTCDLLHEAGLKYVVYDWVHFPPVWLRDDPKPRTLMRCLEHGKTTNYLSIFDPRTLAWYDHFYHALHDHFGDRIDDVYACILGPYGEGNYPLEQPDWVNMGHCHEGYWCGDEFAIRAFRKAMEKKYSKIEALNEAWQTTFGNFDEVVMPEQIKEGWKPAPGAFQTAAERRRWLDFITWYHQSLIDFADQSVQIVLKYFPKEKVRTKPGGNAGGVNPIAWGTYCPGFARTLAHNGICLQPADCRGAVFGDKWVATAYRFYHVPLSTEPAGGLNDAQFARRIFSDASCGASQLFTYEFDGHADAIRKFVHLLDGRPGETEIAVYGPTTLYRLGGDLAPTIEACERLRDLCEFDVLDELLIADGALTTDRYKVLIVFQSDFAPTFKDFTDRGGKVLNIDSESKGWLRGLSGTLKGMQGVDGAIDGIWTCRRGDQVIHFNTRDATISEDQP